MSWILITNLPGFYANMSFIKSLLDVSSYQLTSHILHPGGSIVKLSPWVPLFIDGHSPSGVVNTDCCIWFPSYLSPITHQFPLDFPVPLLALTHTVPGVLLHLGTLLCSEQPTWAPAVVAYFVTHIYIYCLLYFVITSK